MTTYRTVKGYNIKKVSSDPANVKEGQIWYNSTVKTIKVAPNIAAWASGGDLNTGRQELGGCGIQTAGLAFGGSTDGAVRDETEEYDGTSWTESGDLSQARNFAASAGTQTAGLYAGGN